MVHIFLPATTSDNQKKGNVSKVTLVGVLFTRMYFNLMNKNSYWVRISEENEKQNEN